EFARRVRSLTPPAMTEDAPAPPKPWTRDGVGWLTSLLLHLAICLALAIATLPATPLVSVLNLLAEDSGPDPLDELSALEEPSFDLGPIADEPDSRDAASALDGVAVLEDTPAPALSDPVALAPLDVSLTLPTDSAGGALSGVGTDGRGAESRAAWTLAKGGSARSEAAVARGLAWLAEHQNADGTWSLVHSTGRCRGRCPNDARIGGEAPAANSVRGATALALLPFLGAGQTPSEGRHRRVVRRGLAALVRLGREESGMPGRSWSDNGRMYAHGLATIALGESYGMTGDSRLRAPADDALAYLVAAQHERGGWRYRPGQSGDTSVTGWQVMALKSGQLAGLSVPPRVAKRAGAFLDSVAVSRGAEYRYTPPSRVGLEEGEEPPDPGGGTPTLTAVGLLSRMYLGWRQGDPRLARGIAALAEEGPDRGNYYFNYYAAQAIFHATGGAGPVWRAWNEELREQLIAQQETEGHRRGSWWVEGPHNRRGGRLYTTALAVMTLEVYYRYLPLYQTAAVAEEFPD
ncbi:MAG: hypothetical protein AAF805_05565, partial [Planctomycetota bacterium]